MTDDKRLDQTAELLKVLAHPARLHIVRLLSQHGELSVSKIVNELSLEQSLTSHHLIKMNLKRLLVRRRQGKEIWYSLADPILSQVVAMVIR